MFDLFKARVSLAVFIFLFFFLVFSCAYEFFREFRKKNNNKRKIYATARFRVSGDDETIKLVYVYTQRCIISIIIGRKIVYAMWKKIKKIALFFINIYHPRSQDYILQHDRLTWLFCHASERLSNPFPNNKLLYYNIHIIGRYLQRKR